MTTFFIHSFQHDTIVVVVFVFTVAVCVFLIIQDKRKQKESNKSCCKASFPLGHVNGSCNYCKHCALSASTNSPLTLTQLELSLMNTHSNIIEPLLPFYFQGYLPTQAIH